MTSELLFGEEYEVLEMKEKWVLIRSLHDGYEAWIDRKQHSSTEDVDEVEEWLRIPYLYNKVDFDNGAVMILPMGSRLSKELKAEALFPAESHRPKTLIDTAKLYLGTPYRWGGRTPMGIDCSGFVQNVYAIHGTDLPRDAWQQAELGDTVNFVEEAKTGDLAYFDNSEGTIIHVGIVIDAEGKKKIIHASGKVRVDELDHEGIYIADKGEYSHKLRIIKRLV